MTEAEYYLRSGLADRFDDLGDDSPLRAQIAFEILSKALDYSKLVRVQRTVVRNGKTFMQHKWVKPDKVKKGDVVVGNRELYEKYKKEQEKQAGQASSAETKPAGSKPNVFDKMAAHQKKKRIENMERNLAQRRKIDQSEPKAEPSKPAEPPKPAVPPQPAVARETEPSPILGDGEDKKLSRSLYMHAFHNTGVSPGSSLASSAEFGKVMKELHELSMRNPNDRAYRYAAALIIDRHCTALYGDTYKEVIDKYRDTPAKDPSLTFDTDYPPQIKAAAVMAWGDGGSEIMRRTSGSRGAPFDPVTVLYTHCLEKMIQFGGKKTESPIYRGLRVPRSYVTNLLATGALEMGQGLTDASGDEENARAFSLNTKDDEVSVVLELAPGIRTLELYGDERVFETYGLAKDVGFRVESVTQDADGVCHVRVTPGGPNTKPVADDALYEKFNAIRPQAEKPSDGPVTEAVYWNIIEKIYDDNLSFSYNQDRALQYCYGAYGYDGAVQFLERDAAIAKQEPIEHPIEGKNWLTEFGEVDCGFSAQFLVHVHNDWCGPGHRYMRQMEGVQLTAETEGDDIRYKIYDDAMNALVEHGGMRQPGTLYRGVTGSNAKDILSRSPGDTCSLRGISSTSVSYEIAEDFAMCGGDGSGAILEFPAELNLESYFINGYDEAEWLVRDQQFKIVDMEYIYENLCHVKLGLVGDDDEGSDAVDTVREGSKLFGSNG